MTRVLHVISGLGMGGAERTLVQLASALQRNGMPQHIVALTDQNVWSDALSEHGVPVEAFGIRSLAGMAAGAGKLARIIERTRPDVIQGWMPHGNLLATLSHYFAHDRSKRGLAWNLRATNLLALKHRYTVWLTALMSPLPNAIVAVSQPAADFHLHHGYRPRRLKIIHNGVDTDKFQPNPSARVAIRNSLGIGAEETVAIHVARLDPMKNHGLFLEAIRFLPQIRGLLVGAGTETLSLPKNALALGLRRDVDALYASADIVVSTSSYGESFGNVIAEGMSTGCIPIATDVGLFRHLVDDTGQVIAPNNKDALVAGLEEILALDFVGLMNRKILARARIVENFSIAKMIDNYAAFYASFLGGPLGADLSRR